MQSKVAQHARHLGWWHMSHMPTCLPACTYCNNSWVNRQNNQRVEELWTEGVRDYLKFVEELLRDFKDVVPSDGGCPYLRHAQIPPQHPSNWDGGG
eukprot:364599-Chlamydomonas_euryale.AAC.16